MSFMPGQFPAGAAAVRSVTSLVQHDSSIDESGGAFTLPNDIQAGDLIVVYDFAQSSASPPPTTVVPSGFTSLINANDGNINRLILSAKIAEAGDAGAVRTGMDSLAETKLVVTFRGDVPISQFSFASPNSQITTGNPTSQSVTAASGLVPLIVLAAYFVDGGAVSPRTFSPAKDGEVNATTVGDHWLAWKIYNSSPADTTVDMDDEGTFNGLLSCYITCA